jgi:hypothetical protein
MPQVSSRYCLLCAAVAAFHVPVFELALCSFRLCNLVLWRMMMQHGSSFCSNFCSRSHYRELSSTTGREVCFAFFVRESLLLCSWIRGCSSWIAQVCFLLLSLCLFSCLWFAFFGVDVASVCDRLELSTCSYQLDPWACFPNSHTCIVYIFADERLISLLSSACRQSVCITV